MRSNVSSAISRPRRIGRSRSTRRRPASASRRRRGPERALGRLSSCASRPRGRNSRGGPLPGGMLHFGIPAYRLPREDLMREIERIEAHGREDRRSITTSHDVLAEKTDGRFDAVFVAIGAQSRQHVRYSRARCESRVLDASSLCATSKNANAPHLGRRVIIYGGGNTAMDAARTARRLGARRGADRLPARPRATCRATISKPTRRIDGGRQDQVAHHDQGASAAATSRSRK